MMTDSCSYHNYLGVILLCLLGVNSAAGAPTFRFPFGIVEGVDLQSVQSLRPVHAYYGIPYAEPPLRFKAPVPYTGRAPNNVVSSTGIRTGCMQQSWAQKDGATVSSGTTGSEDCLHLNVFVPAAPAPGLLKVMVWIHGGGYMIGDALAYMPTDLVADHDVIVVTIHYRLGYLGFLPTGSQYGGGPNSNNGLRDQIMALQWVKDNIGKFGGDASDVTVFGQSAGSSSIAFLALSPHTKGLFTKAVLQSGTALSPWAMQTQDIAHSQLRGLAGRMGCLSWYHGAIPAGFTKYHNDIVECLVKVPAGNLSFPDIGGRTLDVREQLFVGPTVDGDVIPDHPLNLLQNQQYLVTHGVLDRSYMVGTGNVEGMMFVYPGMEGDLKGGMKDLIDMTANYTYPLNTNPEVKHMLDFVYSYPRDSNGNPALQDLWDIMTDFMFVWPAVDFVSLLSKASPSTDIYYYLFDFYPELVNTTERAPGTPHGLDLAYEFDLSPLTPIFLAGMPIDLDTSEARTMMNIFRGTLAEFAKTGNPSRSRSGGAPGVWPRFDLQDRQFMNLSPRPHTGSHVYSKRMSLWQDFLPKVASNSNAVAWQPAQIVG